ncbi:MAG TPA: phasin family protein [Ramlibacter sp.]|nr:phasin family protein [Ramlibacter sp.]
MASSSRRSETSAAADQTESAAVAGAMPFAELTRNQLAMSAEALSAWFAAAEAMQQAQMQMGQRASLLHRQAAENLRKATSPMEVLTIQSTLLMYQVQEAMRYSQELFTATGKAGQQMLRPLQQDGTGAAAAEGGGSAAASMVGAAMNAAGPMADAFQQMFTAPLKAAQQAH